VKNYTKKVILPLTKTDPNEIVVVNHAMHLVVVVSMYRNISRMEFIIEEH